MEEFIGAEIRRIIIIIQSSESLLKSPETTDYSQTILSSQATCKHYGIRRITTLESGFRRLESLEVIEP